MTRSFSSAARKDGRRIAATHQATKRFEDAWCQRGHSIKEGIMQRPAKFARREREIPHRREENRYEEMCIYQEAPEKPKDRCKVTSRQ